MIKTEHIEKDSKYYDNCYIRNIDESPYQNLRNETIKLIPKSAKIIELGCGTGSFAKMLEDMGLTNYLGIDFSQVAIELAKKRSSQKFVVKNAYELSEEEYDTVIAMEFFEHVEDYKILDKIKIRSLIIFTLPVFDDPAHLRFFNDNFELIDYYKDKLDKLTIERIDRWFLLSGIKK